MYLKLTRTAAKIAAAGAVVAASGPGFAQSALAAPAPDAVNVPCSAFALASDITANTGGETLGLAKFCVYKLTEALPKITEDLTIDGNQSTIERSYATNTKDFSIFTVGDADLVLNDVNLRNGGGLGGDDGSVLKAVSAGKADVITNDDGGTEDGGAIDNEDGSVTVNGGIFTGNSAEEEGGAIYSEDDLTVNGASFTGNSSEDEGGAISADAGDPATITGATFTGNSATDGGAIYNDDATTVAHCDFTKNTASEEGGGIYNDTDSDLTVTGSG